MSDQDHYDWPSFEAVLCDLAPDSLTARSLASADRRAQLANSAAEVQADKSTSTQTDAPSPDSDDAASGTDDIAPSTDDEVVSSTDDEVDSSTDDVASTGTDDRTDSLAKRAIALPWVARAALPDPLAPLEIDTSSVRELLRQRPRSMPDYTPVLEALEPLPELQLPDPEEARLEAEIARLAEEARLVEELEAEEARLVEEARLAEEERLAEEARLAEEERLAEEARLAEEERLAEEARLAEEQRIAEEARLAEEAEEARLAEEERLAEEARLAEESELDIFEDTELELEPELDQENIEDIKLEFDQDIIEEPDESVVAPFDAATDGVAFDTDSPWDSEFTSSPLDSSSDDELNESLVFELDDATLSEVDAAATVATPIELKDPYFDEPTPTDIDAEVFSASDVPELSEPNPMDVDADLLDDPFGDVSIDEVSDELEEFGAEETDHTDGPGDKLWNLYIDDPEQDVQVDELDVDGLDAAPLDSFPIPEPADIPDIVSLSYGDEVDSIELPNDSYEPELFHDLGPLADSNKLDFSDLTSDLGDQDADNHRYLDPDDIDQRKANLFESIIEPGDLDASDQDDSFQLHTATFDSVAAAEEIEDHLDSLIGFDDGEVDADISNVVPIRPEIDHIESVEEHDDLQDTADPVEQVIDGLAPRQTEWASLPPEAPSKAPDPWAHMRPVEDQKKKGFWANRPRFLGGPDRRKAQAESEAPVEIVEHSEVGISYDKGCPNCGDECQVDLDDPIGRRVHVSCPSCKHMWHTPYIVEESQTG